ncbi:huntingtin-interacting protein M [Lynx canadensis]|uniref:Huntingtin-interacting protein M n=1 Tax=Acinonyx jubatus TaxID=32536 RepID=A0A6I9ZZM8_ACIJB|nr:huntingtin-interacting protein M [Acinonyx jubatus]XP_030161597.1 huntingtin-interacting protein M [Lynx canadensis]XP_046932289.1 huntingtin-interacting protein M [Lynx rufus]
MSGKKIQASSCQTPSHLIRSELKCPLSYVDRLLLEDQHTQGSDSSINHFRLTMLDHLTDYILEMVANEAINSNMHTVPQDDRGVGSNRQPPQNLKNVNFTLLDEMPGPRRSG